MKKVLRIAIASLLAFGVPAFAQLGTSLFAGAVNASNYAYGLNGFSAPLTVDLPTNGTTGGVSATFTLAYGYSTTPDGVQFNPLSTSAPITIIDANGADTATPTAVSCTTPQVLDSCTVTVTFANSHAKGARIVSGSYGLEEAALYASTHGGGLVAIGPQWFANYASHSAGITALTGFKSMSASVTVLDWSGIPGVFSYAAAAGSVYASTTHVLY